MSCHLDKGMYEIGYTLDTIKKAKTKASDKKKKADLNMQAKDVNNVGSANPPSDG